MGAERASTAGREDATDDVPLVVDLDGTLLRTDLLDETFCRVLAANPLKLRHLPVWLWNGRAALKEQLARHAEIDVANLPYSEEFAGYVRAQAALGRPILLATGSDRRWAQAIADHLGHFSDVLASDGKTNLSGRAKADALVKRFGHREFDYAGNSRADFPVWASARRGIVVNASSRVNSRAAGLTGIERVFAPVRATLRPWIKQLRLHQWVKNILVFVPMLAGHRAGDPAVWMESLLAFLAFGLAASSVYLLNDLVDLEADRAHARKRFRPLAAGTVSIRAAFAAMVLLFAGAFGCAAALPWPFALVLAAYMVTSTSYSLRLKRISTLDVFTLAALYTLRVVAGGAATGIVLSFWLLAFSMFLFLALAIVKRVSELVQAPEGSEKLKGRNYSGADTLALMSLGTSSSFAAVVVLALYVNSPEVQRYYERPALLWLVCPLMLYWLSRIWIGALRGKIDQDPILFAFRDNVSRGVAVLSGLIVLAAAWR
jgi:4-hydroxybenzoate polyprenyltransferase